LIGTEAAGLEYAVQTGAFEYEADGNVDVAQQGLRNLKRHLDHLPQPLCEIPQAI
jgi:hypothetical protein